MTSKTKSEKPTTEPTSPTATKPAKTATSKRKPARANPQASQEPLAMGELAERYLAHLEQVGKSAGTVFSYRQDLQTAVRHFGAETSVASLTAVRVQEYFDSDAVRKTRSGRTKATPTVLKTQRVLRLALVWAAKSSLIAAAPIPQASAKS